MALWRDGRFVEGDPWTSLADDAVLPATGAVIVGRQRWLADRAHLLARGDVALGLAAGETAGGLEDVIAHLPLVVLAVGKYSDGRHFSTARLLRDRHGFSGDLRATGEILRDQVMFFLRSGFTSLDIADARTVAALADDSLVRVTTHYQPASRLRPELPGPRTWSRRSTAL